MVLLPCPNPAVKASLWVLHSATSLHGWRAASVQQPMKGLLWRYKYVWKKGHLCVCRLCLRLREAFLHHVIQLWTTLSSQKEHVSVSSHRPSTKAPVLSHGADVQMLVCSLSLRLWFRQKWWPVWMGDSCRQSWCVRLRSVVWTDRHSRHRTRRWLLHTWRSVKIFFFFLQIQHYITLHAKAMSPHKLISW